jgi:hypothetical protein
METVFAARRKGDDALLLLAEMGLHDGANVAFDGDGRTVRLGGAGFVEEPDRELPFDSPLLSEEQRLAYVAHWARHEQTAAARGEVDKLLMFARRHPFRYNRERHGGVHLDAGPSSIVELVRRLRTWLEVAEDEDVVGDIGKYAGRTWVQAVVPDTTGSPIPLEIHADSRAVGIARFLAFVIRCGGPQNVTASRGGGRTVLKSRDGQVELDSGQYFYFSQT